VKDAFADYARDCFAPARPILTAAEALMVKLHREFAYSPGETTIATPLLDVLARRRGVCQDFAHVMIACLRALGLAARYVSGYLKTTRGAASPARGADAWSLLSAARLGRSRPDQRSTRHHGACDARLGARLRRRLPAPGRGRRRRRPRGLGEGRNHRANHV